MSKVLVTAQRTPIRGLIKSIDDLDRITISQGEILCSTEEDPEMRPLEHRLHVNRYERRKAAAIARKELPKGSW